MHYSYYRGEGWAKWVGCYTSLQFVLAYILYWLTLVLVYTCVGLHCIDIHLYGLHLSYLHLHGLHLYWFTFSSTTIL